MECLKLNFGVKEFHMLARAVNLNLHWISLAEIIFSSCVVLGSFVKPLACSVNCFEAGVGGMPQELHTTVFHHVSLYQ